MSSVSLYTKPAVGVAVIKGCGYHSKTYPLATSHILIVASLDEETRKSPEGMKHTDDTLWSWPTVCNNNTSLRQPLWDGVSGMTK